MFKPFLAAQLAWLPSAAGGDLLQTELLCFGAVEHDDQPVNYPSFLLIVFPPSMTKCKSNMQNT